MVVAGRLSRQPVLWMERPHGSEYQGLRLARHYALSSASLMVGMTTAGCGGEGERRGVCAGSSGVLCVARPLCVHSGCSSSVGGPHSYAHPLHLCVGVRTGARHLHVSLQSPARVGVAWTLAAWKQHADPAQLGLARSLLLEMMQLVKDDGGIGNAGCDYGRFCTQLVVRLDKAHAEDAPGFSPPASCPAGADTLTVRSVSSASS